MTETLNKLDHPGHFDVHHENGEALMCMSSGGECRVLVEVMEGYTPEEEQQLIASTTSALEAIDQYTGGKAADIFTGLHIKIGEDVAEGGAKAVAEENQVLLNGRKMLLSVAEMRQVSGTYSDEELAGFPDEQRPGGALEYTLVHEIGHVLDGQTKTGEAYHRVAASESPTKYGQEADEWHSDNKDHEAFAEGFAHAIYGMPVSETMEATVRETIDTRVQEIAESQASASAEVVKSIDGVEYKQLFDADKQKEVLSKIESWFEGNKQNIPEGGIVFDADRSQSFHGKGIQEVPGINGDLSSVEVPTEILSLFDRILEDSLQDPTLRKKDVRFIVERTGGMAHDEDRTYHVDTRKIYWDEAGNRVGYDSARSPAKYMVYVGRPGTIIIHDKVDSSLTHEQANEIASQYSLDPGGRTLTREGAHEPAVSQLLPKAIYKVDVGDLIHTPPLHEDGLMITALFNR